MCGICGTSWRDEELCLTMARSLKHRGPDDEGFYSDERVTLGHRRLSIIDIALGHQPMHNEDKSIWIVYNGEIYNFTDLRSELQNRHSFYSRSDTEAIVHAYEEYGTSCVELFNGMWAFCIYDQKKRMLFLSRDRFGIKPIYYAMKGDRFAFASEEKALISFAESEPNDQIILEYLLDGRMERGEETFFKGINRIMPATNLIFNLENRVLEKKRYWEMREANTSTKSTSGEDREYAATFLRFLEDATRIRLISEVPIGTCLSGGLDSSTIVCLVNKILLSSQDKTVKENIGEKQKTFSAIYDDRCIDEREYMEEVIKSTDVEGNYTSPSGHDLFKEIEAFTFFQDEPLLSTSAYAQWSVMRLASRKVKVLLDGQGSDELLAGYIPYFQPYFDQLLREGRWLSYLRERLLSADLTIGSTREVLGKLRTLITRTIGGQVTIGDERSVRAMEQVLSEEFLEEFPNRSEKRRNEPGLAHVCYEALTQGDLQHLLKLEDRNSMAFSIESRVPFLDHRLVEYVISLPLTQRIKNGWTKYILRNATKGLLSDKIRNRRSKLGFPTPEERWLKENQGRVAEILSSESFRKRRYFNHEKAIKLFREFCEGARYPPHVFWRLVSLEMWLRVFFDNEPQTEPH